MLEVANDIEEFNGDLGIKARGRLIKDGNFRILHENLGEAEALAHAAREGVHAVVGDLGEPDMGERGRDLVLALLGLETDQAPDIAQIVGRAEIVVEADLVGQIADPALDRERFALGIIAQHPSLPVRDFAQAEQHQDRGGLAGAVRPEHTENLAGFNRE